MKLEIATQMLAKSNYNETSEYRTPTGLKNLSVIKRCPQSRGSLTKIVIFGTKHFVRYSRHIRYLGCPLLASFTLNGSVRKILEETYI